MRGGGGGGETFARAIFWGEGWVASSAPPPPPPDSSRRPRFFECFPPPSLEGILITSPLAIYVKEPGAAIPPPPPLILPLLRVDPGCDSFGRPRTGEGGGDGPHNTCGVGKKCFPRRSRPKWTDPTRKEALAFYERTSPSQKWRNNICN